MIPRTDRRIKKRIVPDLSPDRTEYDVLLEDMIRNGGMLIPDPNWLMTEDVSQPAASYDKSKALDFAQSEDHYRCKVSSIASLMNAWVGSAGPPTHTAISRYRRFLEHCDPLQLWQANVNNDGNAIPLLQQDLGTLMDVTLLYVFSLQREKKLTTILEVGGGYGRLAEAVFNIFGPSVRYVMVDAVPASLYYAKKYLSCACPDARVASWYDGGTLDLSAYDIAVVPAWHFDKINTLQYDICVNIESMQEMSQHHVDYYLNLFQSASGEGATIYLSNAHEYYFRGVFNHPRNWQKVFCANTPRSWCRKHPTEIFTKTSCNCSLSNSAIDSMYQYGLDMDVQDLTKRYGLKKLIPPLSKALLSKFRHQAGRAYRPLWAACAATYSLLGGTSSLIASRSTAPPRQRATNLSPLSCVATREPAQRGESFRASVDNEVREVLQDR
jgi:hypothetical protein